MKKITFLILLLMFIPSCSLNKFFGDGLPTEADARAAYDRQTKNGVDTGTFKVNSFRKTNGQMINDKMYVLYWEAEIEYAQDIEITFMFQTQKFKAGEKIKVPGQYRYMKTDNGWKQINEYGQLIE